MHYIHFDGIYFIVNFNEIDADDYEGNIKINNINIFYTNAVAVIYIYHTQGIVESKNVGKYIC